MAGMKRIRDESFGETGLLIELLIQDDAIKENIKNQMLKEIFEQKFIPSKNLAKIQFGLFKAKTQNQTKMYISEAQWSRISTEFVETFIYLFTFRYWLNFFPGETFLHSHGLFLHKKKLKKLYHFFANFSFEQLLEKFRVMILKTVDITTFNRFCFFKEVVCEPNKNFQLKLGCSIVVSSNIQEEAIFPEKKVNIINLLTLEEEKLVYDNDKNSHSFWVNQQNISQKMSCMLKEEIDFDKYLSLDRVKQAPLKGNLKILKILIYGNMIILIFWTWILMLMKI